MEVADRISTFTSAPSETRGYPPWVTYVETYQCVWPYCTHTRDVWRRADARKSFGHLKYIYCGGCTSLTEHEKIEEFKVR